MKKLFLGKSKRFLIGTIVVLVILGSVGGIFLKGALSSAQQANTASHPSCSNAGGPILGIFNPNAICNWLVSLSNTNKTGLSSSPTPIGQIQTHFPNTTSWSNPPNGSPTPSPTSNPSTKGTQSGQNSQSGQTQTGSNDAVTQAAQAVFNQINSARAQAGLPALQWSTQLVNSAHNHNLAMQSANQLSHQLPSEPELGTRITQVGVNWSYAGENIGESSDYQHPTSAATGLDQAMLDEQPPDDGHRLNILSKNYTIVGIDVLIDTTNYKVWLTEDFARPA